MSSPRSEPVAVVVDTREQLPYSFDPERVVATRGALRAGDYSLVGLENRVAVERKSLDDFVSTVIRDRDRFRRELDRLRELEAACVVVEGNLSDLLRGSYSGGAHPSSVFGSALSIIVDHEIPVYFCSDRQAALRFVEGFLLRFHRKATS
jgi:DNA excision repair protein ERCC-4